MNGKSGILNSPVVASKHSNSRSGNSRGRNGVGVRSLSLGIQDVDFMKMYSALERNLLILLTQSEEEKPYEWEVLFRFVYKLCICNCRNIPLELSVKNPFAPTRYQCREQPSGDASMVESMRQAMEQDPGKTFGPQPHLLYYMFREKILVEATIQNWAWSRIESVMQLTETHGDGNLSLLETYIDLWSKFKLGVEIIHPIFHHLNRDWIQQGTRQGSVVSPNGNSTESTLETAHEIRKLCLLKWKEMIFIPLQYQLVAQVLQLIDKDRHAAIKSRHEPSPGQPQPLPSNAYALLKSFLDSLITLNLEDEKRNLALYESLFERQFLERTSSVFYKPLCVAMIVNQQTPVETYVDTMQYLLDFESKRSLYYLHPSTKPKLLDCIVREVVDRHLEYLLDNTLETWLFNNSYPQLSRMYHFLSRSPDISILRMQRRFQDIITETGMQELQKWSEIQASAESEQAFQLYVEAIITIFSKFTEIVQAAFHGDRLFMEARDIGCKRFINRRYLEGDSEAKSADYLAKYCHVILKPNTRIRMAVGEGDVEQSLDMIISLFGLLDDTDVFLQIYSILLARRLIHGNYVHYNESTMISKLRQVCSYDRIYKLQRMFKDMDVSHELNDQFQHHPSAAQIPLSNSEDFSAMVLTYGSWPYFDTQTSLTLPWELSVAMSAFEQLYRTVHKGRKLIWLPSHSRGIVRMHIPGTYYDIQVTTFQLIVLLQFQERDVVSMQQFADALGLSKEDCLPIVESLVKCQFIRWHNVDKKLTAVDQSTSTRGSSSSSSSALIPAETQLRFNFDFASKHRKISANKFLASAGGHSGAHIDAISHNRAMKQVSEDRKYAVQACIVRLLKARKHMAHSGLVSEVLMQLQTMGRGTSHVALADIKRNIDTLIEHEFIERTSEGYAYSA